MEHKETSQSLTETTSETTTDINTPPQKISPNGKPKLDPALHILQAQSSGVSEKTGPNPLDNYFTFRDKALAMYTEKHSKPTNPQREIIVDLANEPGFDLAIWEKSFNVMARRWRHPGHCPLDYLIGVYEAGGDYEKFAAKKWPPEKVATDGKTGLSAK